jgi:hypothetical protein
MPAMAHLMFETWLCNFNGYFAWLLWSLIIIGLSNPGRDTHCYVHNINKIIQKAPAVDRNGTTGNSFT